MTHEETAPAFAAAPAEGAALRVRGGMDLGSALWIGFYTSLLNIVTLTIFRFWGRTQFRRALWSATTIGGERLEYTGRGMELFVGFLIALVTITLPFVVLIGGAQMFLDPIAAAVIIGVAYIFFFVLIGVALFLARRYHLSRTRYRGIRFAQTGSAWGYGFAVFGYTLLTIVTLGWFGPAARIRLSRGLWGAAWYGSARFRFEDTPEAMREPVYRSFAAAWVGSLLVYALAGAAMMPFIGDMDDAFITGDLGVIGLFYLVLIGALILVGLMFAWHEAVITRRITKSLRLDGLAFSSRFSALDLVMLTITNVLIVVFTLGFGYMVAQARLWNRYANRLSLSGAIDFDAIRQSEANAPKQGEGLADGFDLVSNF